MLAKTAAILMTLSLSTAAAFAGDLSTRSAVGGGLGGALGGLLGAELAGRNGAIVGSGLGAAVGTAVATDGYRGRRYYVEEPRYYSGNPCPYGLWKKGRCGYRYDD
ncbi:MAG: hypothetical protein MUC77_07040 [Chromatiaceae bacterium]|jgi:hypothetical protein|nr:hypothetical protein [Chromatiaceae bacterium]